MSLYSLGSNGSGQLGLSHTTDISIPTLVKLPPKLRHANIIAAHAGGNHTLLQTSSAEIYAAGDNSNGKCASQLSGSTDFRACNLVGDTKLSAATWEASFFVSADDGLVRVCGTGLKGELGLSAENTTTSSPTSIPNFPPQGTNIVDLAACMGHVVVVLNNGEVWGWGNDQQGQLGDPAEVVWRPRKIQGLSFAAVRAVCAKDFTAVFGHPEQGTFAIFGLNKRDRFGVKVNLPGAIRGWKAVQATWGGVYVLMDDGKLTAWGRDDHGQLPPADLPKVEAIAAGSEHVLALTTDGRVLTWGWGEHGNCGDPVDDRKDVKGRWNELCADGEPIAVGAGCATSWIVTKKEQR